MYSKKCTFVTVLIALSMLLLQNLGIADTYQHAYSNGHFRLDGINGTAVNVNASKAYYSSTGITSIWGTMDIISYNAYANPPIATEAYSWTIVGGVYYQHSVITSKSFLYTDYVNNLSYNAHIIIALTQFGPFGQCGIQVVRDSDGVVTNKTAVNNVYAEIPFSSGGVAITE